MARWIMPSSRPSLIKHTMPWAKAGRGARLLKGIDEGLVNIHGLVQKSWSTNEEGENIPYFFHRFSLLSDVVGR